MIKGRRRDVEGFVKQTLARGGTQQIFAAHNFGDSHFGIIDHDSELVRRKFVVTPDDKIAEMPACFEGMRAGPSVVESNLASVWNTETPIHLAASQISFGVIAIAAGARVSWF